MSTMLFDCEIGVSAYGLSGTLEHSGMVNLMRFSYKANSRINFGGIEPKDLAFCIDFSYAAMRL